MQEYEIKTYIDNIPYLDVNEWEICRLIMYQNIQINSKKQFELKDILNFKWDSDTKTDQQISNRDIERLKQKQKLISEQLQNG